MDLVLYRRRVKFVDRFSIGCRRLAARGGVIHAIRRMVHELSSRSVDQSQIRTRGVQNPENFADVIYGRPLTNPRSTVYDFKIGQDLKIN